MGSLLEAGVLVSVVRNHYISKTDCLADIKFFKLKKKKTHQQSEANDYIYLGAKGITL